MSGLVVGIATRFVPAGIEPVEGAWMLRGTIVLVPVVDPANDSCGQSVDLAAWPSAIEALLDGGIAVAIAPVEEGTKRPEPPASLTWVRAQRAFPFDHAVPQREAAQEHRRDQVRELDALWRTLMTASGVGWSDLLGALGPPKNASILDRISRDVGKDATDGAGQKAQKGVVKVPDILPTGRAEMGLMLALERGRSVLERIRDPQGTRDAEALRTREKRATPERRASVPWLDPRPALIRLAEASTSSTTRSDAAPPGAAAPPRELGKEDEAKRIARRQEAAKALNASLGSERSKTDQQADARQHYDGAKTPDELRASLDALSRRKPSCRAPGHSAACAAGSDTNGIEDALDRTRRLHRAATNPSEKDYRRARVAMDKAPDPLGGAKAARARFFALQSQPILARLFNFAVDVVVPLTDATVTTVKQATPHTETVFGNELVAARYLFVTCRVGKECGTRLAWTTAKIRLPDKLEGGKTFAWTTAGKPHLETVEHFWACTREELDARAVGWTQKKVLDSAIASQIDGLLDLGANRVEGGVCNPRFDILTLDAARVSDADIETDVKADGSQTGKTLVRTIASGGLLLVDRWRQYQAVIQAVSSLQRTNKAAQTKALVIDVEDLTVGLKLDVGIETTEGGKTGLQWRSLVDRDITFGEGSGFDFKTAIETILPKETARRELSSALLTLPARLRENDLNAELGKSTDGGNAKPESIGQTTAFVEEIVAQWNGGPLGVDLHGSERVPGKKPATDEKPTGGLAGTGLLELSQTYALPTTGKRPPRLRFGWPYRFGVRPQLAGGVVLPLDKAQPLYDAGYDHRLALPRSLPGTPGRRALRHERIEAPIVTTPAPILKRMVRGPQETATELVLRTVPQQSPPLGAPPSVDPVSTHRVVFPPQVSLEFADRHDIFRDAELERHTTPDGIVIRPRGGLRDVDFDQRARGGFPIWSRQEDSAGKTYPDDATLAEPTGDAIFRPRESKVDPADRPQAYYPDPAARFMVFRLRHRDGTDIPGESLIAPVRRSGVAFPDVTPVVVDVVRASKRTRQSVSQKDVLGLDMGFGKEKGRGGVGLTKPPATVYLDDGEAIQRVAGTHRVPATRVEVLLEPGESFQLDIWCISDTETLLAWFDMVESASLVASAYKMGGKMCRTPKDFSSKLSEFFKEPKKDGPSGGTFLKMSILEIEQALHGAGPFSECGAGQLPLPSEAGLACTARLIHEAAREQLIPEIAARVTLGITHALDKPYDPPSFAIPQLPAPAPPRPGLALLRVGKSERDKILGPEPQGDLRDLTTWKLEDTARDSTDVVLGGFLAIDRATTGFVEVRATGANLLSGSFDDPSRGRSEDDRARGIWPDDLQADGRTLKPRRPVDMFGFDVAANGTVRLVEEEARLLRIEGIEPRPSKDEQLSRLPPKQPPEPPDPTMEPWPLLDLLWRQRQRLEALIENGTSDDPAQRVAPGVSYPDKIADTKARILALDLVAGSNTAQLIHDPFRAPLSADDQTRRAATPQRVALPSTKAPARVEPLTLLPAFLMIPSTDLSKSDRSIFGKTRSVRLRLRVRRPWFSSGAGERLGIVLWPPDFLDGRVQPDANHVHRGYDVEDGDELMDMTGLSDLDLGPGGAFVSRWGADPIKAGPRPSGWLLSPSAFRDVSSDAVGRNPRQGSRWDWTPLDQSEDEPDIVYVQQATMPLPVDPDASSEPRTMEVALLACRPRFDIDKEHWFFDLNIDPSIFPEPFVRLGLVRYQANAPSQLRVSEPVVEWAQLLPERQAYAAVSGRHLAVTVKGVGSPLPAMTQGNAAVREDKVAADLRRGPRMKVTVYRRSSSGVETVAKLAAPFAEERARRDRISLLATVQTNRCEPERPATLRAEEAVSPAAAGAEGLLWEAAFELEEDPRAPVEAGVTYSVVASEVDVMRPATYPEEPFDPGKAETDDRIVESGPRFAVRIGIPRRDAPPQSVQLSPPSVRGLAVQKECTPK